STDRRTRAATLPNGDNYDTTPPHPPRVVDSPHPTLFRSTQAISDAAPNVGDTITITTTLSNAGPDGATNVSVADLLPAGLSFVSAAPSHGTYDNASGVRSLGTVASEGVGTLTVTATVVSP